MQNLHGKRVVITGGSQGLGFARRSPPSARTRPQLAAIERSSHIGPPS
jgi:hypothetical protein